MRRALGDPLPWVAALLVAAVLLMGHAARVFAWAFPGQARPVFEQESFLALTLAHMGVVLASSAAAALVGVATGIAVSRPGGRPFRDLADTLVAIGQTVPPVAVLAVAVPAIGFGFWPAFIALALYGLLPILRNTVAGLDAVPGAVREAARGIGMSGAQSLLRAELPLALPVILAGLRVSVIVNVGTAAIASTVGARTLGLPIILGLTGANTAYVIQGAVILALLAIVLDLAFERLSRAATLWRAR
jgi:osmoprotectant transport system permease protein